jgi:hypothetical protein
MNILHRLFLLLPLLNAEIGFGILVFVPAVATVATIGAITAIGDDDNGDDDFLEL